jgi:tetratricopeptide (TPR) repeat protein
MKKKLRTLIVMAVMIVIGLVTDANAKLVAHWELDETGGKTARDSTGNGNDGKLIGGVSFDNRSVVGAIHKGLRLDDDRYYIRVDAISLPKNSFTISLWLSPNIGAVVGKGGRMYLMFWGGPARPAGDKPYLVFNKGKGGKLRFYVTVQGSQHYIESTTATWQASVWYHVAATFDETGSRLYINGVLESTGTHRGSHYASRSVYFGGRPGGAGPFAGSIDDIRIYDEALSAEQVSELMGPDEGLQSLIYTVPEADTLIEQAPEKAIAFLQERIAESKQWKEQNPSKYVSSYTELIFDLYYLLAKAKKATGAPTKEVDAVYDRAFELGTPSVTTLMCALVWLHENGQKEEYEAAVQSLNKRDTDCLGAVLAIAEKMVDQGKAKAAVGFIEGRLAAYRHWRNRHANLDGPDENLPKAYFLLAKAKEAVAAPKQEVADAYGKTFIASTRGCVAEQAAALIWLLDETCAKEYTAGIRALTREPGVKEPYTNVISKVCQHFESTNNWPDFELFLDVLLSEPEHAFDWARFVGSCCTNKLNRWAQAYAGYLANKPRLRFGWDWTAERHLADGRFKKAAQLYRDIISRCSREDGKQAFELQFCKCLFLGGKYDEAIAGVDSFVANAPASDTSRTSKAMLIKGQACIQLGQLAEARESLSSIISKYPKAKEVPQARLLKGYCHMLQDETSKATEEFRIVVRDFPQNSYASKARLCLLRIPNEAR